MLSAEDYVSIEELEALATSVPRSLRDPKAMALLLRRLLVTFNGYRAQVLQLNRDVQQARMQRERLGQATTMSPLDAVRFLSPEQLAPYMDALVREKAEALARAKDAADQALRTTHRELNRVKFAISGLLEEPTMNEHLRTRLVTLMRQFQESGEALGVPGTAQDQSQVQLTGTQGGQSAASAQATADAVELAPQDQSTNGTAQGTASANAQDGGLSDLFT